jgi:hypothetical protein
VHTLHKARRRRAPESDRCCESYAFFQLTHSAAAPGQEQRKPNLTASWSRLPHLVRRVYDRALMRIEANIHIGERMPKNMRTAERRVLVRLAGCRLTERLQTFTRATGARSQVAIPTHKPRTIVNTPSTLSKGGDVLITWNGYQQKRAFQSNMITSAT